MVESARFFILTPGATSWMPAAIVECVPGEEVLERA